MKLNYLLLVIMKMEEVRRDIKAIKRMKMGETEMDMRFET